MKVRNLEKSIKTASWYVSNDESRDVLCHIFLEYSASLGRLDIVATDGHVLYHEIVRGLEIEEDFKILVDSTNKYKMKCQDEMTLEMFKKLDMTGRGADRYPNGERGIPTEFTQALHLCKNAFYMMQKHVVGIGGCSNPITNLIKFTFNDEDDYKISAQNRETLMSAETEYIPVKDKYFSHSVPHIGFNWKNVERIHTDLFEYVCYDTETCTKSKVRPLEQNISWKFNGSVGASVMSYQKGLCEIEFLVMPLRVYQ